MRKKVRAFAIRCRAAATNREGAEYVSFLIIILIVVIVGALLLTTFKEQLFGTDGIVSKLFAKIKTVFADAM